MTIRLKGMEVFLCILFGGNGIDFQFLRYGIQSKGLFGLKIVINPACMLQEIYTTKFNFLAIMEGTACLMFLSDSYIITMIAVNLTVLITVYSAVIFRTLSGSLLSTDWLHHFKYPIFPALCSQFNALCVTIHFLPAWKHIILWLTKFVFEW